MKALKELPFAVYSVLISLGVGLVLWFSHITGEAAAILSALGLELVIVVHRVLVKVEKLSDPVRGLPRSADLDEALTAAREIVAAKNPQATALLEGSTHAFANRIKAIRSGGIKCSPSEFMEFAEGLFARAKRGDVLRATSHLAGGEYWQKVYGRRYEALNREAQLRGLAIERTYLLRDEDHLKEVRDILDRQSAFSSVLVVLLDNTDDSMEMPRRDFFVYNDQLVAEFYFTNTMVIDYIQVSTEPEQITSLAAEYVRIREAFSEPYVPTVTTSTA